MKNNKQFTVKVWDILHNLWTKDTVSFVNKFSTKLPHLWKKGLSFDVQLQSLSDEQLQLSIPKVTIPLSLQCDYCGKGFEDVYYSKRLTTKAVKESLLDKNMWYEISIDEKNHIIDIEQWLVESIVVTFPVSNMCKTCKEKPTNEGGDIPDNINITWKKV